MTDNADLLKGADTEKIKKWRKELAEKYPFLKPQTEKDKL